MKDYMRNNIYVSDEALEVSVNQLLNPTIWYVCKYTTCNCNQSTDKYAINLTKIPPNLNVLSLSKEQEL